AADPARRWEKWRPTVSICQQEDLLIDRFELLYDPKFSKVANIVTKDLVTVSPETEVRPHHVTMDDPWDFQSVYGALYDFASHYPFDPDHEDYLIHITTGTHVCQICLFLLAESRRIPARLIQTAPPKRKQNPVVGTYSIIDLDLSRYDPIASRFETESRQGQDLLKSGIQTRNAAFNTLVEEVEQVAVRSRHPILLTGPTGAGKSQLAKRIYQLKTAKAGLKGKFVEVNCATIKGDAAMSALFGHKKGSFTGAVDDREGLLRAADQGLLFLDEIGELGLDEQAMFLRAIEEKRFLPLGSDEESESDFTLISGTHRNLAADVADGRFREDLLARINLWSYEMPSLADRKEDISPNIEYELNRYAQKFGTLTRFNKEAQKLYLDFANSPQATWNGNFRDLNASITRMATLAGNRRINADIAVQEISRLQKQWSHTSTKDSASTSDEKLLAEVLGPEKVDTIDPFDKPQLATVIRACRKYRNLSEAGRHLFSQSRQAKKTSNDSDRLRKYLAKFGLTRDSVLHQTL
ncbi:MAG: RNA repair transcriptional activator RtcR, partial [Verrucomicrobiota bacterium]